MTTTELRDLDAYIAEHVFGATRAIDKGFACGDGDDRHTVRFNRDEGWTACPFYTTDSAAAIKVLERCAERFEHLEIMRTCEGKYMVWVHGRGLYKRDRIANTLPLAICLLAQQLFKEESR